MRRREIITFPGTAAAVWKRAKRPTALLREAGYLLLGVVSLAAVTGLYFWLDVPLVATAFTYLVVLVLLALVSHFSSLIVLSLIGGGCLNYFFTPPIYSFRVDYPRDIVTISAFVITSFVVNFLVTRVRGEQRDHRRSEAYLAEAQRLSRTGTWVLNPTTMQYLYWSDESYRIWGFDPLQGFPSRDSLWERIHDRDKVWEEVQEAVRQKKDYSGEFKIVLPNGTVKYLAVRSHHLFAADGELVEVIGTNVDVTVRKRAEEALRESEARFRDYAETASDWFCEMGPDYKFTLLSENAFGSGAADRIGTACWDHALDLETEPEKWRRLQETVFSHKPFRDFVYRGTGSDGSAMYVRASGKPLFDANGEFHGYRGTCTDVTEIMQAQEALRESERRSRSAIDGIAGMVAIMTPNGEIETVNRQVLEYFGRSLDELKSWGTSDAVHPEDLAHVVEMFTRAMASGLPYHYDQRLRRFDGEYRWFDNRGVPIHDDSGQIARWYVLITDIEDRKRAQEALRESEAHLAEAQRLSHTGAVAYNGTAILFASEETYHIWGFDPAQGLPSREIVFQRIHPGDRDWLSAEVRRAVGEKRRFSIAYRILLPDGTVKHLETIGQPVFSASGKLVEIFATQTDVTERKRAEEALRESERSARSAIDGIAGLIAIMGPNGELEAVNRQVFEYYGRSLDELKSWGTSDVVHPEDLPRGIQMFTSAVASGIPFHYDQRLRRFDGEYRWFDIHGLPIRDDSGRIARWYALHTDIEDRKRAEQALRESEAKFRDYAETASDWLWEIGPDYRFTLLSENAFGSGAADRIGTACWDHALDLETEPEKWRLVRATLDSRKPFRNFVYRGLGGTGSPMYVKVSGKPVFDANGEFHGYRGASTDVTALMRAEEALRESERSARSAIDGIAGLVAVLAPNGEVETVNRQVLEYFGRSLEEIRNLGTNDTLHPEDLPRVLELNERGLMSGLPFGFDLRMRRFDGEYRWFEARVIPVHDGSGRIERWYNLVTDIEDRIRALARLEQMQSDFAHINRVSMMGELAASLSHEITQPIASARNNARAARNFLDMQPPDLREVREALNCVAGDTDRAEHIIDRIRDHIKKTPPRKGPFDLNEAINEVISLGRSAILKNRVWVQTRLCEGLGPVHGDRVQLQQVVLNLLLNAVEAMSLVEAKPRDLLISTEQDHTGVLVAVRDSGPGIDPEHLEQIFKSFYTTKPNGTGMGLAICRSIIDAHGGRLWAEANEPRGTIFLFTLPGAEAKSSTARPFTSLESRNKTPL
jgi:PAS domain S-box-containing protein